MSSPEGENKEYFRQRFQKAIEFSTNSNAQFHVLCYAGDCYGGECCGQCRGGEWYFRAFGYGPPPEKPVNSGKDLNDLTLRLNLYVDITTPQTPSIYYIQSGRWTHWYRPDTIKRGQTTLPRARILRGTDRELDLVSQRDRQLDWYSRRRASEILRWPDTGNGEIPFAKLNLDMSWLAAKFQPANAPSSQFLFTFSATESPSPSKLYQSVAPSQAVGPVQPVTPPQTVVPPQPVWLSQADDDEEGDDAAAALFGPSAKDKDRESYFTLADTTRQLGDALEGTRKDLETVQAALANKKHSLAFAHNQIRRLRRVSRENRRRHSRKIQKLKLTVRTDILNADKQHMEEVQILHKEFEASTAEYSQQILTLQEECRDNEQKNVHEIQILQEQLEVTTTKHVEEVQSLKEELKSTEEKYVQELENLKDESRRDKQTVAVLQKERTVLDGLRMQFRRTMSACVITGLVSLQFILVARNLNEVA